MSNDFDRPEAYVDFETGEVIRYPKPEWLVESNQSDLAINDLRLLDALIAHSWNQAPLVEMGHVFEEDYRAIHISLFGEKKRDRRTIKTALENLKKWKIKLAFNDDVSGERLFSHAEIDNAIVKWVFDPRIHELISETHKYGNFDLKKAAKLTSKYAYILNGYAAIYINRRRNFLTLSVDEWRKIFGAHETLSDWSNFLNRCLRPAINQINELDESSFSIRVKEIPYKYKKNSTQNISFTFEKKDKVSEEPDDKTSDESKAKVM